MTLIVGIVDKETGTVYMGADRIVVNGMSKNLLSSPKIIKNGEFLIGSAGYVRGMNLLEYMFEIPEIKDENITKYMVKEFIPELIKCCKENNFYTKESETIENLQDMLVGVRGRLYQITGGFEVNEISSNYMTVGYGTYHANGMLEYAINNHKRNDYNNLIKEIIKNTCKIVNYVEIGELDVDILELKKIKEVKKTTIYILQDGTKVENI